MDRPRSSVPATDMKLTEKQLLRIVIAAQRDLALLIALQNVNEHSRREAKILALQLTDVLQGIPK